MNTTKTRTTHKGFTSNKSIDNLIIHKTSTTQSLINIGRTCKDLNKLVEEMNNSKIKKLIDEHTKAGHTKQAKEIAYEITQSISPYLEEMDRFLGNKWDLDPGLVSTRQALEFLKMLFINKRISAVHSEFMLNAFLNVTEKHYKGYIRYCSKKREVMDALTDIIVKAAEGNRGALKDPALDRLILNILLFRDDDMNAYNKLKEKSEKGAKNRTSSPRQLWNKLKGL